MSRLPWKYLKRGTPNQVLIEPVISSCDSVAVLKVDTVSHLVGRVTDNYTRFTLVSFSFNQTSVLYLLHVHPQIPHVRVREITL